MDRVTGLMKEFVEKRGPELSELILVMIDADVGGSCPAIIWLWSVAFTSI